MPYRSAPSRLAPVSRPLLASLLTGLLTLPTHAAPSLHPFPYSSAGTVRYVAPAGACHGAAPCYPTVQAAVDAAVDGDLIKIAAGTYSDVHERSGSSQVVRITKTLTLRGGYSTGNGFADPPRPDIHPTTLDAQSEGRVIVIDRAGPTLEGLTITGGAGYFSGGGISAESGSTIILNCEIVGNKADGDGGGVFINRGSVQVLDSRITNNHSLWSGGLRIINDAEAVLIGNYIVANEAEIGAGGIDLDCCGSTTSLVARNVILDNQGGGWGGGVSVSTTKAELTNNIIAGNEAAKGAGIWLDGMPTHPTSVTLRHNTLVARGGDHGVSAGDHVTALLTNNILAGFTTGIDNTSPADSTITARSTLFRGNGSDYGEGVGSSVEIKGDPAFVDPPGHDYHIGASSAAVDRGREAGVTEDIDGQPRPLGPAPDIGADEICRPVYLPIVARRH